jgi:tRNA dimethylallyltransferase
MFEFRAVGVDPGDELPERISGRLDGMLAAGLLDEVARLAPELGATARQAVGYKELIPVLAGEASLATGAEDVRRASLALAKRQRTFFRRDPRIDWLPWADDAEQRYRMALAALRR